MSNTKTIVKNTGWFGLENAINVVLSVFTSIAIARTLGPTRMGYIIYVTWIASAVGDMTSLGIPNTTRKYMAEFLGKGDRGTARYIFFRTLTLQAILATIATVSLLFWVLGDAAADYKLASVLVVLSIWPLMVNGVPSQANAASEELSRNLPASAISIFVFFIGISATMIFHWGVVGVGASMLAMRLADFLIRLFPALKRVLSWETEHVEPEGLRGRMITYAWQSVATMMVEMIVWQRSEFIILKHLCSDIRQVAYYSVAFSMAEYLLLSAGIFGMATSTTIFAQYGRDKSKVKDITATAVRYLALSSIPLHLIATALAAPILLFLYGNAYKGAALVATIAPLMCLPKAFLKPVRSLLQSHEKQTYLILALVVAAIADFSVAWYLIPANGAVGACIGSGVGQTTALGIMWIVGIRLFKVKLPWGMIAKITASSVAAALTAHYIALQLAPLWGILCGGTASLLVLFSFFYILRVLEPEDHIRLSAITRMLPRQIAAPADSFLHFLVRPALGGIIDEEDSPRPAKEA